MQLFGKLFHAKHAIPTMCLSLEKVELKLHLKETNASFPPELSEWEQKERSVKVDIMANENAAAMLRRAAAASTPHRRRAAAATSSPYT